MTSLLLIAAGILVILILLLVFRVHTLLSVMRGEPNKVGLSNKINGAMLPIAFAIGLVGFYWSYNMAKVHFLPEAASVHGVTTDFMFWFTMVLLVMAFVITNTLLFWFPYKYQYSADRKAYFYPDNHKLEIIWTIIPAVVMTGLVYYGLKEWNYITTFPAEKDCEVIEVMGRQFAWKVRYPGKDNQLGRYKFKAIDATNEFGIDFTDPNSMDDFVPGELHLPKGKQVLLRIRARDVLHSVFLPHFRVKMDAVPGMPTKFWFIPTKTTAEMRELTGDQEFDYVLACTEVCGKGHYTMKLKVVVDEPEDYEAWKATQTLWSADNADYVNGIVPGFKKEIAAPAVMDSVVAPVEIVDSVDIAAEIKKTGFVSLHVKFAPGKSDLDSVAMSSVNKIYDFLNSDKDVKVEIDGFTDNSGDPKKNKALSKDRAQSIVNALVKKGISKKRLIAKGYGEEKPIADNSTEAGKAMNRRVEIRKN
jgi:cytochrome c oxidase subunit 2